MHKNRDIDLRVLATTGGEYVALSQKDRWRSEQRWREVFARGARESTGHSTQERCEWHTFSLGFTRCARDHDAVEYFGRVVAPEVIVTPHYPDEGAYRCRGGVLPSYLGLGVDRYLFDPECTWTMVFTHEPDCGPYYCESRWLARPGEPVA